MDFAKLGELSIGLAMGLGALWLSLQIIKASKRNGGNHTNKAGDRSTEEWEGRMRKMHEESEERVMADMRNLLKARNDEIRRIVREEMERK